MVQCIEIGVGVAFMYCWWIYIGRICVLYSIVTRHQGFEIHESTASRKKKKKNHVQQKKIE